METTRNSDDNNELGPMPLELRLDMYFLPFFFSHTHPIDYREPEQRMN
jgi:hypothetical protein